MTDFLGRQVEPIADDIAHLAAFCVAGLGADHPHTRSLRWSVRCIVSGVGGQGVQLAAQTLARAAALEGREVTLFGVYGGTMRGGNTDSTVVIGDTPIEAAPIVSHAWSAIVMSLRFWQPGATQGMGMARKLAAGRPRAAQLVALRRRRSRSRALPRRRGAGERHRRRVPGASSRRRWS